MDEIEGGHRVPEASGTAEFGPSALRTCGSDASVMSPPCETLSGCVAVSKSLIFWGALWLTLCCIWRLMRLIVNR